MAVIYHDEDATIDAVRGETIAPWGVGPEPDNPGTR